MSQIAGCHKTIAVMQPYFLPYAGYFRLMAAADLFVIYDCVQFPRRGWLHRNRLRLATGTADWLTLPLGKAGRETVIRDLEFAPDAVERMAARCRRFPALAPDTDTPAWLHREIRDIHGRPVDYIAGLLRRTADTLGLPWQVARSSDLALPATLKGQDRILAIARAHGATRYLNPPGGRGLYDAGAFAAAGIELRFLGDHPGSVLSIAQRLADEDAAAIAREIRDASAALP